jgi:hypothetical protein
VLVDEGFEHSGELLLLAAGELRGGLEQLFHLTGWTSAAFLHAVRTTKSSTETLRASARLSSGARAGDAPEIAPIKAGHIMGSTGKTR